MNTIGLWLIAGCLPATLFALAGIVIHTVVRRGGPAIGSLAATTAVVMLIGVPFLTLASFPRWWTVALPSVATPAATSITATSVGQIAHDQAAGTSQRSVSAGSTTGIISQPESNPNLTSRPALAGATRRVWLSDLLATWRWPEIVGTAFSVGFGLALIRLLLGLAMVQRYRARSVAIRSPLVTGIARQIASDLGLHQTFDLHQSAELASPATVGWWRPVVLLPAGWEGWSHQELRVVLSHEIAHIARRDYLIGLIAQLSLALHFYDPLVHWLTRRLRLEQELVADALGAELAGGHDVYLVTLTTMVLRLDARKSNWAVQAFLPHRGTFLRRIEMLSEGKSLRRGTWSGRSATALVIGMACVGLAVVGVRVSFGEPSTVAASSSPTNSDKGTVSSAATQSVTVAAAAPPVAKDRKAEIDAAIARLREGGAFVREFHPRNDPQYWVKIISTNTLETVPLRVLPFDDADLDDVEIIGRGVPVDLHLRHTSVTPEGLAKLASAAKFNILELTGGNVDDVMLKVLPKLPLTGHLGLDSNLLTDAGIGQLKECQHLASVGLKGDHLTDGCLEHLVGLPQLTGVNLGRSFTLAAFPILGRLKDLRTLELPREITPKLSDFVLVPNLRRLSLWGKHLDDESALNIAQTFKSLEQAYLRETSITNVGFKHLSQLKTLEVLTLDGAFLDDGIADSIRAMKRLKWLSLERCDVGDTTVAALSECPELWYVALNETRVTDEGLASLIKSKKLGDLKLMSCKLVTDAGVKYLSQLANPHGVRVNIQATRITQDGARRLQKALPTSQITWGIPAVPLK